MSFNPKTKRYNYTDGDVYTLSGQPYVGYFNVENKTATTGRTRTSNSQNLQPTSNIAVDLYQYEIGNNLIFQDRLIVDAVNLPNNLDEIIIPPNEIVTNRVFTAHLKRLYENTLYLYSQLSIASNDIPNRYLYWIGVSAAESLSANEQKWNPSNLVTTNLPYGDFGYPEIDESNRCITVIKNNNEDYISFTVSDTTFSVISSKADKSSTAAVFSTSAIDLNSDKIYSKIEDIAISDNKYVYIADSGNNAIYKYDISGYTSDDITIADKKFLLDVFGQQGDLKSRTGFDEPTVIEANSNRVYIFDSINKCIKTYTTDFAWINTFILNTDITILDLQYNKFHNAVFALAEKDSFDYTLIVFDYDAKNIIAEYDLDEKYEEIIDGETVKISANRGGRIRYSLDPREQIRGIRFSSQDSNVFYIFSNYNIYKKFLTKPQATIGKWSMTRAGISWGYIWNIIDANWNSLFVTWNTISGSGRENIDITDMSILPRDDNFDDIFVSTKAGDPGAFKILYCNEFTLYDNVLMASDVNVYNTTRFGTLDDEYINAFTVNKEIYKQSFNIIAMRNLLKGRFAGSYNIAGNLLYEQYDYITDKELENIAIDNIENLYVHENEHVSSEVLNRCLRKLYSVQETMLQLVKTKIKNITPTLALTGSNILRIE
jgi:hypothetical protein